MGIHKNVWFFPPRKWTTGYSSGNLARIFLISSVQDIVTNSSQSVKLLSKWLVNGKLPWFQVVIQSDWWSSRISMHLRFALIKQIEDYKSTLSSPVMSTCLCIHIYVGKYIYIYIYTEFVNICMYEYVYTCTYVDTYRTVYLYKLWIMSASNNLGWYLYSGSSITWMNIGLGKYGTSSGSLLYLAHWCAMLGKVSFDGPWCP